VIGVAAQAAPGGGVGPWLWGPVAALPTARIAHHGGRIRSDVDHPSPLARELLARLVASRTW